MSLYPLLKRYADLPAVNPGDAAFLLDGAVDQLETLRQHHAGIDLQAHAARAIVDNKAIDQRRFGIDRDLAGARNAPRRFDTRKASVLNHAPPQNWQPASTAQTVIIGNIMMPEVNGRLSGGDG